MIPLLRTSLFLSIILTCFHPLCGQGQEEETKQTSESPSPDGKFAFRYAGAAEAEKQTYDLIERRSGKVLASVAESDPDLGPSARFHIDGVLWRPDSRAFAVTAMLWKRGTSATVFAQNGSTFREVELPDLDVDVPGKARHGMELNHVAELDAQKPIRWEKDGSLVMQIETIVDGNEGMVTATRTVLLAFGRSGKVSINKSTTKYAVEKQ